MTADQAAPETTTAVGDASTPTPPVLEVRDLVKHFTARRRLLLPTPAPLRAVQGVSLQVERGQALGIVGESGCGKSTLAKMIMGLHEPTSGTVLLEGRDVTDIPRAEFAQRVQFVFQDPYSSLNPRKTVRQTLDAPLRHLAGLDAKARRARTSELLDLVGLRAEFADRYPHEFSGGQRQRVGIARALATTADVLLLDEPVSALDVSVQAQVLNLLRRLQRELGLTYVFIAHDLAVVENLCDEVGVMYLGRIVEQAPAEELFSRPRHPYTHTLLSAIPAAGRGDARLRVAPPAGADGPAGGDEGCAFAPRCYRVEDRCHTDRPALDAATAGHPVACHFADDTDPKEHAR
jgi:oligopeptide/dipeptide ABC transporter ATP-binding protein